MQTILNKRVIRDLKKNFFRYFALFLLIALGMYLIISIVGAAENVIAGVSNAAKANKVEDGEFTVFVPIEANEIKKLEQKGITLEKEFYLDYLLEDDSTLRIYKNRQNVNLIELDEGKLATQDHEIVLEKQYAKSHDLVTGSQIEIADECYRVTGIGSTPDYELALNKMSDSTVDSRYFGIGFVSKEQYEQLKKVELYAKSEEYVYSYLLNGKMNDDELKDKLSELELDRSKVTDSYFLEMLDEMEGKKTEIQDGIKELSDGANELNDGLTKLSENNSKLQSSATDVFELFLGEVSDGLGDYGLTKVLTEDNYESALNSMITAEESNALLRMKLKSILEELNSLKEFKDGVITYTDEEGKAADGASELANGTDELKTNTDELLDKYFKTDIDNLTQFVINGENPRIGASQDDVQINKYVGIVAGIIIMILFTYVISVFVIHGIEEESTVIGALYALGIKKKQLIMHYLMLPVIVTFLAGGMGMLIGFSQFGINVLMADSTDYFSLPVWKTIYPFYLIIYGAVMPPLVAALTNYFVINKKLSQPVLKMIRNEQKQNKISNVNLGDMQFVERFRIRQFLREIRTSFTVIFGMFIALLVMMLGINCYTICHNMSVQNKEDTKYEYMYSYKYPTDKLPEGGEACYVENLKKEVFSYDLDVTLLGTDDDNSYFDFDIATGKNRITISSSVATKYNLNRGEKLVLTDEVNDVDYAFTIDKIVPYSVGLYVFMNIDDMRELFGQDEDYYNVVYSDKQLDIEAGRLYATTTRADINKTAEVFIDHMWSMIICMVGVSVIIFVVVMYLMMKVMIDRSTFHISLMKIFGFRQKEIKKLYLDGNFLMIVISAAICIPLSKMAMDAMYPYFISNVACGMDLTFTWQMYIGIYVGVILCYVLINRVLVGRLKKMMPTEVLKNRE